MKTLAALTMIAATLSLTAPLAQAKCMTETEAVAEKVRRLKTTLMVGALQCSSHEHLGVTENYNAFIDLHGQTIKGHDKTLSSYFQRLNGAQYRRAMDRHVTSTANSVATQSYKVRGFCEKVAMLAEKALTTSPLALLQVAAANTIAPAKLTSCKAATVQAAQATVLPK